VRLSNQSGLKVRGKSNEEVAMGFGRRSASVIQRIEDMKQDEESSRKVKVLLPKISSKKDLRLETINQ
jgi:hypothetical protein